MQVALEEKNRLYYSQQHSLQKRIEHSTFISAKFPERVPLIVQPKPHSSSTWLKNSKILAPKTSTIGALLCHVRETIPLDAQCGLYYMVDTSKKEISPFLNQQYQIIGGNDLVGHLYTQFVKPDGFCYIYYAAESTFGA